MLMIALMKYKSLKISIGTTTEVFFRLFVNNLHWDSQSNSRRDEKTIEASIPVNNGSRRLRRGQYQDIRQIHMGGP